MQGQHSRVADRQKNDDIQADRQTEVYLHDLKILETLEVYPLELSWWPKLTTTYFLSIDQFGQF